MQCVLSIRVNLEISECIHVLIRVINFTLRKVNTYRIYKKKKKTEKIIICTFVRAVDTENPRLYDIGLVVNV